MASKKPIEYYRELLKKNAYDPNYKPQPEQVVIRIEGKNIGSMENFIMLTGLPKNGKGRYMSAIAAGAISRKEIFGISTKLPEGKETVALFDTEQGSWDYYKAIDVICSLSGNGKPPSHFHPFNVREHEANDILMQIETYLVDNPRCGMILIDGMLDLLTSFNDIAESTRLIKIFKRWTKQFNIIIPAVLHRGKTTGTTLGQLGGIGDRAAQSILIVEKIKERNTFQLRADFLRSAEDFTPIEILYDKSVEQWIQTTHEPIPEKVRPMQLKPHEIDKSIHMDNVMRIFNSDELQSYNNLVENIRQIYARGVDFSRLCVVHLIKEGLIFKPAHDTYTNRNKTRLFIQK